MSFNTGFGELITTRTVSLANTWSKETTPISLQITWRSEVLPKPISGNNPLLCQTSGFSGKHQHCNENKQQNSHDSFAVRKTGNGMKW